MDLGGPRLRALATPGHTHERIAFRLLDGPRTLDVFTGGFLIVGSAALMDLGSSARTEELTRAQYRSLKRLARLDDDVEVSPTHARVLDVRQDTEYDPRHVAGADHIELGALTSRAEDLPDEPLVVMCGHGERAMGAATVLARAGHHAVTVLDGGSQDWAVKSGNALEGGQ